MSSFITGVLNQQMVLETKQKVAVTDKQSYETEITGGSIENINGIHKFLKQKYSHATEHEKNIDKEGGVMSAGAMNSNNYLPKRRIQKYIK